MGLVLTLRARGSDCSVPRRRVQIHVYCKSLWPGRTKTTLKGDVTGREAFADTGTVESVPWLAQLRSWGSTRNSRRHWRFVYRQEGIMFKA